MAFKKVTITIPEKLLEECRHLITKGYFANLSDLIRAGIRSELKAFSRTMTQENWITAISKLIEPSEKTDEDIIKELRKSRAKMSTTPP